LIRLILVARKRENTLIVEIDTPAVFSDKLSGNWKGNDHQQLVAETWNLRHQLLVPGLGMMKIFNAMWKICITKKCWLRCVALN